MAIARILFNALRTAAIFDFIGDDERVAQLLPSRASIMKEYQPRPIALAYAES